MAYTSIIPVHRLDNSVDYVLDEKKASRSQNADSLQAAVDYALNKDKTEQDLFCSAIGCTLDSAFEDMCQIKRMWHKEKGVQGFHLVQSFAAGEVTPELAHQIGQAHLENCHPAGCRRRHHCLSHMEAVPAGAGATGIHLPL